MIKLLAIFLPGWMCVGVVPML